MAKKVRKKFNKDKRERERSGYFAGRLLITGVSHREMDKRYTAAFENERPITITPRVASYTNDYKHYWTVYCCVVGRYRSGQVYVQYDPFQTDEMGFARDLIDAHAEVMDNWWDAADKRTRLVSYWCTYPKLCDVTHREMLLPLFYSGVLGNSLTESERKAGVEVGNHYAGDNFDEFVEWFKANAHPTKNELIKLEK